MYSSLLGCCSLSGLKAVGGILRKGSRHHYKMAAPKVVPIAKLLPWRRGQLQNTGPASKWEGKWEGEAAGRVREVRRRPWGEVGGRRGRKGKGLKKGRKRPARDWRGCKGGGGENQGKRVQWAFPQPASLMVPLLVCVEYRSYICILLWPSMCINVAAAVSASMCLDAGYMWYWRTLRLPVQQQTTLLALKGKKAGHYECILFWQGNYRLCYLHLPPLRENLPL